MVNQRFQGEPQKRERSQILRVYGVVPRGIYQGRTTGQQGQKGSRAGHQQQQGGGSGGKHWALNTDADTDTEADTGTCNLHLLALGT